MSLASYADLQAAVADWLNRADLTARIPDFITLAESRLNRLLRLRVMEQEAALTTTPGTPTIALPSGFLEPLALFLEWPSIPVMLPFRGYNTLAETTSSGPPGAWTIDTGDISFDLVPNQVYNITLRYLQGLSIATGNASSLWLMANAPDLYLYGSLVAAQGYIVNADQIKSWKLQFEEALTELQTRESRRPVVLQSDFPTTGRAFSIFTG